MSEQERREAFLKGLAALCQVHGMNITATIKTEYLGDAVLSRPVLAVVLLAGWQPPTPAEAETAET